MTPSTGCPICRGGVLVGAEGRLDQSGDSYLPTTTWTCPRCEYRTFAPAVHARWRFAGELEGTPSPRARDEAQAPAAPRRAA